MKRFITSSSNSCLAACLAACFALFLSLSFFHLKALAQDQDSTIVIPDSIRIWIDQELSKAKQNSLMDYDATDFFRTDSAKLIGYLKGYRPELGFRTGIIYWNNLLTFEDMPLVIAIEKDGRFEVRLPMQHPVYQHASIKGKQIPFYVEPGQTLAVVLDWEKYSDADRPTIEYKGVAARINEELLSIKLPSVDYNEFGEQVKTMLPDTFKEHMHGRWRVDMQELEKQLQQTVYLTQTKRITHHMLNEQYMTRMFDYVIDRWYQAMSDSTNNVLQAEVKPDFYDFLQKVPLNNQSMLIPNEFSVFVKRFGFSDPFSAANNVFNENYQKSMSTRLMLAWEFRDSVFTNYYKLKPNLIYDIVKTRSLESAFRQDFGDDREEASLYLSFLENKLDHPFLKQTAENIFQRNFPENGQKGYALPRGKGADIFRKIIAPHKGKMLFVDFWATTCGPCVGSIKQHQPDRLQYRDNPDFDFIFITSEEESPEGDYQPFIEEQGMQYTHRLNEDDYLYLRELFRFNGIPRYILVDKDGAILDDRFQMHNFKYELSKLFPQYVKD